MPWRKKDRPNRSPGRLLLWTTLLGFLIGLVGFGQIAEDQLRIARNKTHPQNASGQLTLITIDDKSLASVGRWPWPRRRHADLIDQLSQAGARRIFFDFSLAYETNKQDDDRLADAIRRSNRVVLAVVAKSDSLGQDKRGIWPLEKFAEHAALGAVMVDYNYQNAVWELPYQAQIDGKTLPSFSALAAGRQSRPGVYPLDFSFDFKSFDTVSADQVITGSFDRTKVAGKDVMIAIMSDTIGDRFFLPGFGQTGGAYIHAIGAETLRAGTPTRIGWLPALLLAVVICWLGLNRINWKHQNSLFGALTVALVVVPQPLEINLIFADVAPALFVTLTTWGALLWRRYKEHGVMNAVSGLPNLAALKNVREGRSQALVAARVINYADIVASLPADSEKALIEQIVARLSVGTQNKTVYHGDSGVFAWFEEARLPFGNHIDALHALFRTPVKLGELQADVAICFGVEIGSGRSLANRLASAMLAVDEAAHDGLRWKIHDPEKLHDATWRLSILSKLDEAIDSGQVWVAYQPKLDLRTRRITGAEALARWTHPEKGPIAASEFIPVAEQNDRIGKLTDFVLEQAISTAAKVNGAGREFHVAVNLSARLLSDPSFTTRLSALLLKHLLEPGLLTLEITETSAITSQQALRTLSQLRQLGCEISIDDYGTGLSTLDYLKKVPASEIKIDQSFIKGMLENRGDKVMVQSTIALAHSLNRTVVAEGVESSQLLEALTQMKCDVAQGYIVGRPMSFDSLRRRLLVEQKRSVA